MASSALVAGGDSLFAAAGFYFSRRRGWAAYGLGLGTVFVIGALVIQAGSDSSAKRLSVLEFSDGREVEITAHVTAEGIQRNDAPGESSPRIDAETEQVTVDGKSYPVRSGICISIFHKEKPGDPVLVSARVLRYGDRLRFSGKLYPPRNFRNPGAFDYQAYLAENGIAALTSAKYADIELLPGFAGNRWEFWRTRVRRSIIERVHALWGGVDGSDASGR